MPHFAIIPFNIRLPVSDKCIIFQQENASATERFLRELQEQFRCKESNSETGGKGYSSQISMKTLYTDYSIGSMRDQDFEFIILESALENIVNKFKKLKFPYRLIVFDFYISKRFKFEILFS